MKLFVTTVAACLSFIGIGSADEAISPADISLSFVCSGCHGTQGRGVRDVPGISGWDPEIFLTAMKAFQSGKRTETVMGRIARSYDEEEIAALARYFRGVK